VSVRTDASVRAAACRYGLTRAGSLLRLIDDVLCVDAVDAYIVVRASIRARGSHAHVSSESVPAALGRARRRGGPGNRCAAVRADESRAAALRTFVALLENARLDTVSSLRTSLARSMNVDLETREFRDQAIAELDRLQTGRSSSSDAFTEWRTKTIDEAQRWAGRIVLPRIDPH
jgi:hypothetical protein